MDTSNGSDHHRQPWTNEKHLHYLNSIEASFVRSMFQNNNAHHHHQQQQPQSHHHLRLDRYLPDTSDSTLDLKTTQRKRNHVTSSSSSDINIGKRSGVAEKKSKRKSHKPYSLSHDQVAPQIEENRGGDKGDNDLTAN